MNLRNTLATTLCLLVPLLPLGSAAQDTVTYRSRLADGSVEDTRAVLRLPAAPGGGPAPGSAKAPALVILHHAGGFEAGTTSQHARFFADKGFVTLEPVLFNHPDLRRPMPVHQAQTMAALAYLAGRDDVDPKRIHLMGLSLGAHLAWFAATTWSRETFVDGGALAYAKIAPLYPVCWVLEAIVRQRAARFHPTGVPQDVAQRWQGQPVHIFAAGLDDYNDRDPEACASMVASVPDPAQRARMAVTVYPDATHGWDQRSQVFYEAAACKGQGCYNRNAYSASTTQRAQQDVLRFLLEP